MHHLYALVTKDKKSKTLTWRVLLAPSTTRQLLATNKRSANIDSDNCHQEWIVTLSLQASSVVRCSHSSCWRKLLEMRSYDAVTAAFFAALCSPELWQLMARADARRERTAPATSLVNVESHQETPSVGTVIDLRSMACSLQRRRTVVAKRKWAQRLAKCRRKQQQQSVQPWHQHRRRRSQRGWSRGHRRRNQKKFARGTADHWRSPDVSA